MPAESFIYWSSFQFTTSSLISGFVEEFQWKVIVYEISIIWYGSRKKLIWLWIYLHTGGWVFGAKTKLDLKQIVVLLSIFSCYSGIFYSCQFIKSFRPFHSIWEEEDSSREINTSFTEWHIIISWISSFRIIQSTVPWHSFKSFMFVFINFWSLQKLFEAVGY